MEEKIRELIEKIERIGWGAFIAICIALIALIALAVVFEGWLIATIWNAVVAPFGVATIGTWDAILLQVLAGLLFPVRIVSRKD